jgi:hypothetical protein
VNANTPPPIRQQQQQQQQQRQSQEEQEREMRALALYAMQMREMLEGSGSFPVVDMNPYTGPYSPVQPQPVQQQPVQAAAAAAAVNVMNIQNIQNNSSSSISNSGSSVTNISNNIQNSSSSSSSSSSSVTDISTNNINNNASLLRETIINLDNHGHGDGNHSHHHHQDVDNIVISHHSPYQAHHHQQPVPHHSGGLSLSELMAEVDASVHSATDLNDILTALLEHQHPALSRALNEGVLARVNSMQSWLLQAQLAWTEENNENESLLGNIRMLADRCKQVAIQNAALKGVTEQLVGGLKGEREARREAQAVAQNDRRLLLQRCVEQQQEVERGRAILQRLATEKEERDKHLDTVHKSELALKDRIRRHDLELDDVKTEARRKFDRAQVQAEALLEVTQAEHRQEVSDVRAAAKAAALEVETRHSAVLAELETQHSAVLAELEIRQSAALAEVKAATLEMEARNSAVLAELETQHSAALAEVEERREKEVQCLQEQLHHTGMEMDAMEEIIAEERAQHHTHTEQQGEALRKEVSVAVLSREQERQRREILEKEAAAANAQVTILLTDKERLHAALQSSEARAEALQSELSKTSSGLKEKRKSLDYHESALLSSWNAMRSVKDDVIALEHHEQESRQERQQLLAKLAVGADLVSTSAQVCERVPQAVRLAVGSHTLPALRVATTMVQDLAMLCHSLEDQRSRLAAAAVGSARTNATLLSKQRQKHAQFVSVRAREEFLKKRVLELEASLAESMAKTAQTQTEAEYWRGRHVAVSTSKQESDEALVALTQEAMALGAAKTGLADKLATATQELAAVNTGLAVTRAELKLTLLRLSESTVTHQVLEKSMNQMQADNAVEVKLLRMKISECTDNLAETEQQKAALQQRHERLENKHIALNHRAKRLVEGSQHNHQVLLSQLHQSEVQRSILSELLQQAASRSRRINSVRDNRNARSAQREDDLSQLAARAQKEVDKVERIRALAQQEREESDARQEEALRKVTTERDAAQRDLRALSAVVISLAEQFSTVATDLSGVSLVRWDDLFTPAITALQGMDSALQQGVRTVAESNLFSLVVGPYGMDDSDAAAHPSQKLAALGEKWPALMASVQKWASKGFDLTESKFREKDDAIAALEAQQAKVEASLAERNSYIALVNRLLQAVDEPLCLLRANLEMAEKGEDDLQQDADATSAAEKKLAEVVFAHSNEYGTTHTGNGAEVRSLASLWAHLHVIDGRMHDLRDQLRHVCSDMERSTATRIKQEWSLDQRIHALDNDYHTDDALQHELDALHFNGVDNDDEDAVSSISGLGLGTGVGGNHDTTSSAQNNNHRDARGRPTVSMGKLVSLMMEAAETSLATECTHNLKLGECLTKEIKKRRQVELAKKDAEDVVQALREEKQYLEHLRDNLEHQLERDRSMMHDTSAADFSRNYHNHTSGMNMVGESKQHDADGDVTALLDASRSIAKGANLDSQDPSYFIHRSERDFKRLQAELRKARVACETLKGDVARLGHDKSALRGSCVAKDEEIEGLRRDLVTLASRANKGDRALAERTALYEAALAQVEKMSVKAAKEKHNRKGMEEVVRGLDLQLSSHVSSVIGKRSSSSRRSNKQGATAEAEAGAGAGHDHYD